jgi:nucleoside 2-deoxyribosyltransferase
MRIYLAIPYSFNTALSYQIVNKVAADLMQQGHIVFSPISHGHPIAEHLPEELRTDSEWWMKQDLPFIEWCDELHIISIGENGDDLIEESKGCVAELQYAMQKAKPIQIISYENQSVSQQHRRTTQPCCL